MIGKQQQQKKKRTKKKDAWQENDKKMESRSETA